MKSGITTVCSGLLCVLAAALAAPRIDVPAGFEASTYATGIAGARDVAVRPDGTVTLLGLTARDSYEIDPPLDAGPVTVMRVAMELDADAHGPARMDRAIQFASLDTESASSAPARAIPVEPRTLALAQALDDEATLDVAIAPDGTLYVADSNSGRVWRVSRESR